MTTELLEPPVSAPAPGLSYRIPNAPFGRAIISSVMLTKALDAVGFCVETNNTLPVLERVQLTFTPGSLMLHTSNLKNTATLTVPVDGEAEGVLLIPYKILRDLVKALPEQPLMLLLTSTERAMSVMDIAQKRPPFDTKLELVADAERYALPGEDANTFPKYKPLLDYRSVQVSESLLANLLATCLPFIHTDDARPAMNALKLQIDPPAHDDTATITLIGSDGHVACRRVVHLEGKEAARLGFLTQTVLIPRQMVAVLAKKLDGSREEPITIRTTESRAEVSGLAGGLVVSLRLTDQKYPDTNVLFGNAPTTTVIVGRPELIHTLERLGLVNLYVAMTVGTNKLTLEGDNLDLARSGRASLYADTEGPGLTIGMMVARFLTVLRSFETRLVVLDLTAPNRSVEVRGHEQPVDADVSIAFPYMLMNEYIKY